MIHVYSKSYGIRKINLKIEVWTPFQVKVFSAVSMTNRAAVAKLAGQVFKCYAKRDILYASQSETYEWGDDIVWMKCVFASSAANVFLYYNRTKNLYF